MQSTNMLKLHFHFLLQKSAEMFFFNFVLDISDSYLSVEMVSCSSYFPRKGKRENSDKSLQDKYG